MAVVWVGVTVYEVMHTQIYEWAGSMHIFQKEPWGYGAAVKMNLST
jgi:hypothetical protein